MRNPTTSATNEVAACSKQRDTGPPAQRKLFQRRRHQRESRAHTATWTMSRAQHFVLVVRSSQTCRRNRRDEQAYTLVNMSEGLRSLRLTEKERPRVSIRILPSGRPKQWDSIEEPLFSPRAKPTRSPSVKIAVGKERRRSTSQTLIGKGPNVGFFLMSTVKSQLFLSVYLDAIKMVGGEENLGPMWEILRREIDLESPTPIAEASFFWVASRKTQKLSPCCPSRCSLVPKNHHHRSVGRETKQQFISITAWSYDIQGYADKMCRKVLRDWWTKRVGIKSGGNAVHG